MNRSLPLSSAFPAIILLLFCVQPTSAQEDYEKWLKQHEQAFQQFKEERDRKFVAFLKKEWQNMQLRDGLERYEQPKPVVIPEAERVPPRDVRPPDSKIIRDIPVPDYVPVDLPDLDTTPDLVPGKTEEIEYFDMPLKVTVDDGFYSGFDGAVDNEGIGAHWQRLSNLKYEPLLMQVQFLKEQMELNDWGYGRLLHAIATQLYPKSKNDRNLFLWFMLSKSGYAARIGYHDGLVFLLLPSENTIYGQRFFNIDGTRYYLLSFDDSPATVQSLFTYDGDYPGATAPFGLGVRNLPLLAERTSQRQVAFRYGGKMFEFDVQYNRSLVSFFEHYPLTDMPVYFGAPISAAASRSLVAGLKPIIKGKTELEAVNILLRFVQTAFPYKTDGDQFGREKYLFAEETLFYPYSDCEDRSVLFAYLVHQLLGLDVIGLNYPGHIATAVAFSSPVDGEHLVHGNRNFVICDPTYINATAGMTMPAVAQVRPEVIELGSAISFTREL